MTSGHEPPFDDGAARRLLDAATTAAPGVGECIGSYRLVEEIARSETAAVYRAAQRQPVERDVAIKLLLEPTAGSGTAARFRRERSLLARIRHPGVVTMLDAGDHQCSAGTFAWFAMPFVAGESILHWCGRQEADAQTRVRLIEDAARAVGAAHAIGVVHRDLKPSNILVAGTADRPVVQVIDFGIAKVLEIGGDAGGDAPATRLGSIVGTPEYMSPEQADLEDASIGPQSDVYSLGLVLFQLLAGFLPGFETPTAERLPMGARLRIAAGRAVPESPPSAAIPPLGRELAWILRKACARHPSARYANAGALADDLERLRLGRPVVAAPADSGYEVFYFLRRFRSQFLLGAVAIAVAIGALGVEVARERARADESRARRDRLQDVLSAIRERLEPVTGAMRGDLADDRTAVPVLQSLHEIDVALFGGEHAETRRVALNLARALDRADRPREAEGLYRGLLAAAEADRDVRPDPVYMRLMLGGNLRRQGGDRLREARETLEVALAAYEAMEPPPYAVCNVLLELAFVARAAGDRVTWLERLDEGLACAEPRLEPGHLRLREIHGFLGDYWREGGDFDEARDWYALAARDLSKDGEPLDPLPGMPGGGPGDYVLNLAAWLGELRWMEFETGGAETERTIRRERLERAAVAVEALDPDNLRLLRWRESLRAAGRGG